MELPSGSPLGRSASWLRPATYAGVFDYATVGIGLYGAAAGIPVDEILTYQNAYAAGRSDFKKARMDPIYTNLAERNVFNTKLGYQLYQSGRIGQSGQN